MSSSAIKFAIIGLQKLAAEKGEFKAEYRGLIFVSPSQLEVHPDFGNLPKNHSVGDLVESINTLGFLKPIIVVSNPDKPGNFFVVDGKRRLSAARRFKKIPCYHYMTNNPRRLGHTLHFQNIIG